MEIEHVVVGPLANNVFTIRCASTGEGILIDAADEDELLLEMCKRAGVRRVITTHGHFDHIGAVVAMRDAGIDIAIHDSDASMLPTYDIVMNDTDEIHVGDLIFDVLHTPGHTPGSVCLALRDTPLVFTGDTLFPGGPGATHFPGGDFGTIMKSIDERLMTFPDDAIIIPGHGAFSTIGNERDSLAIWVERGW